MTQIGTSASPQHISSDTPASPWRRHKRIFILCGVLLLLSVLFEFNPLHPIRWAHDTQRNFRAGWRAASLQIAQDSLKALQTAAARARAQVSHPAQASSATAP